MDAALAGKALELLLAAIGFFAVVAAATPNKKDDGILRVLRVVLDILGANVGNAKSEGMPTYTEAREAMKALKNAVDSDE